MTDVTVLIDADPLVYRVGFASERARWRLDWVDVDPEHKDDPDWDKPYTAFFRSADRLDEFVFLRGLHPEEFVRQRDPDPEPLSFALRTMRESLDNILETLDKYFKFKGDRAGDYKLFLTGGDQFRDKLATIKPYKGNRDRSKRPYWYREIREYLVSVWGAEVCDVIEADDAVAIRQWQQADMDSSVICTLDKDLLMVPGHHLNYSKKTTARVEYPGALLHFYRQLLTGDTADNIPGLKLIGKVKAEALLPKPLDEPLMYRTVLQAYEENMALYPEFHAPHTDPAESLLENARLLWMMDHPDRLWTPPGAPEASLAEWLKAQAPADPDGGLGA